MTRGVNIVSLNPPNTAIFLSRQFPRPEPSEDGTRGDA
jgi:hypothetical protein